MALSYLQAGQKSKESIENQVILQAEQQHSDPFQDCMRLLNREKVFSVLKWLGKLFHRVAEEI